MSREPWPTLQSEALVRQSAPTIPELIMRERRTRPFHLGPSLVPEGANCRSHTRDARTEILGRRAEIMLVRVPARGRRRCELEVDSQSEVIGAIHAVLGRSVADYSGSDGPH